MTENLTDSMFLEPQGSYSSKYKYTRTKKGGCKHEHTGFLGFLHRYPDDWV